MTESGTRAGGRWWKLLLWLVLVAVAGLALWLWVGDWIGSSRQARVRAAWKRDFGRNVADFVAAHPARVANPAALELEGIVARLGIDLATKEAGNRVRPTPEAEKTYDPVKKEASDYLKSQMERPTGGIEPPPPALAAFLEGHAADLEAARGLLLRGEGPLWEMDLEKVWAAPIPNLLGTLQFQRLLLADALAASCAGDAARAQAGLEASWNLDAAHRDSPILITRLISVAVERMQAGALRHVEGLAPGWRERVLSLDPREPMLRALVLEGQFGLELHKLPGQEGEKPGLVSRLEPLARPVFRLLLARDSDRIREALVGRARDRFPCAPAPQRPDAEEGFLMNPGTLLSALDRVSRVELDLEMTARVLEAKAARDAAGGKWPAEIPGIGKSRCAEGEYAYQVTPDGGMSLAFSREVKWEGMKGVVLPTRFDVAAPAPVP